MAAIHASYISKPKAEKWPCAVSFGFVLAAGGVCWLGFIAVVMAVLS